MARFLSFARAVFKVCLIFFQLVHNQNAEIPTENHNENEKAKTMFDFYTRVIAYKDLMESKCYLELMRTGVATASDLNYISREGSVKTLLASENQLTKQQVWNIGGTRVLEFCRGYPTFLLQKFSQKNERESVNEISTDNFRKNRRRRSAHYFRGRVRGQTQSQYLSYGGGNNQREGKAEAESTYDGSKAVVVSSNGMGSAQSQSSPFGCEECLGPGTQEQVIHIGRGGIKPPGHGPGDAGSIQGIPGSYIPGQVSAEIQTPGIKPQGIPSSYMPGQTQAPLSTSQLPQGPPTSYVPGQIQTPGQHQIPVGTYTPGQIQIQGPTNGYAPGQLHTQTPTAHVSQIPGQAQISGQPQVSGSEIYRPSQPGHIIPSGPPVVNGFAPGSTISKPQQPGQYITGGQPGTYMQSVLQPIDQGQGQVTSYTPQQKPISSDFGQSVSGKPSDFVQAGIPRVVQEIPQKPGEPITLGRPGEYIQSISGRPGEYVQSIPGRPGEYVQSIPGRPGHFVQTVPGRPGEQIQITQKPGEYIQGVAGKPGEDIHGRPSAFIQGIPGRPGEFIRGPHGQITQLSDTRKPSQTGDFSGNISGDYQTNVGHGGKFSGIFSGRYSGDGSTITSHQIGAVQPKPISSTAGISQGIYSAPPGSPGIQLPEQISKLSYQPGTSGSTIYGEPSTGGFYGSQGTPQAGVLYEGPGTTVTHGPSGTLATPGTGTAHGVTGTGPSYTVPSTAPSYAAPGTGPSYVVPSTGPFYTATGTGPSYDAPSAGSSYTAPGTGLSYAGPGTGPSYVAPGTRPSYAAPGTGSYYEAPGTGPSHAAPGTVLSYAAPGTGASHIAPDVGSSYTAPGIGPSYSAPGTGPSYAAPGTRPSYAAPGTGPSYAAPSTGPSYTAPGTGPSYAAPGTGPSYAAPGTGPSYAAPSTGPSYTAPGTGPSFTIPGTGPSYATQGTGPSYAAPGTGQSYAVPGTGPTYVAPGTGSSSAAPGAGPTYTIPGTKPSYGTPGTGPIYAAPGSLSSYGTTGTGSPYGRPGLGLSYESPGTGPSYGTPGTTLSYAAPAAGSTYGIPGTTSTYIAPGTGTPGSGLTTAGQVSTQTGGGQIPVSQSIQYGPAQAAIQHIPGQDSANLYGAVTGGADDADSQAQTSVQQINNETQASASAQGRYEGGLAQSQVSGSYHGTGSFSASAGTNDGKRGAQTEVNGGKEGATSTAQGSGGMGLSQAQVQLASESGDTLSTAQSGGYNHGSNTQVQASNKGGMADAQANGPGSTSSQAQIGFIPNNNSDDDDQKVPFRGGGTASAQSGTHSGQTQSQIQGKFRYGIKYTGAAQAASGNKESVSISRNQSTNNFVGNFPAFKPLKLSSPNNNPAAASSSTINNDTTERSIVNQINMENPSTNVMHQRNIPMSTPRENNDDYDDDYDDYEEEDEENRTEKPSTKSSKIISQTNKNQKQHIVLDPLENIDATVQQVSGDDLPDGTILQPGQIIPGFPGYQIPLGFRGRVSSSAGTRKTVATGHNSQAQSVTLKPGIGRVIYNTPVYAVSSNTHLQKGGYGFGSGYTYHPTHHQLLKSGQQYPNFVSVSKSETGSQNVYTGKKTPSVYYTQSSSCGYFTNTCIFNKGSKICIPKPKTNPDGSPIIC